MWSIMSQPDTEDALIARKGWNCLSCAKKLEKYRGKIGEQVNWNGLTTTNYSPPRVGYSQSVSHNTTQQNITMPASKPRQTN
jgi:predicted ATP-dependent serine protease